MVFPRIQDSWCRSGTRPAVAARPDCKVIACLLATSSLKSDFLSELTDTMELRPLDTFAEACRQVIRDRRVGTASSACER